MLRDKIAKCFRSLFPLKGYTLSNVEFNDEALQVEVKRDGRCGLWCPICPNQRMKRVRSQWQSAYDLPIGAIQLILLSYEAVQGWCPNCRRHHTIHPEGIDSHQRATRRVMDFVSRLCRRLPLNQVIEFAPVPAATAYRWDKQSLQRRLPEPDFSNLQVLLVDEKHIGKGHPVATFVMNGLTGELLFMETGKKDSALESFFKQLTREQKQRIEAVVIDRDGAYRRVIAKHLSAKIIYDKFHVIANYNEAIDEVRRKEYNRAHSEEREVIKGQRYNLFRNPDNRTSKQDKDLEALLAANANLHVVYVLKEALKRLWTYRYPGAAQNYLSKWVEWAMDADIPDLSSFAYGLLQAKNEIVAYCRYPFTNGRLEGFNNIVSRILHRTCGVYDLDYLYLRLRQETVLLSNPLQN